MQTKSTFCRDISVIIGIGLVSYAIDFSQNKDTLYTSCSDLYTQMSLLLHHIYIVFSLVGWASNNKTILILYVLSAILVQLHWIMNNNKCAWTQFINKRCNNPGGHLQFFGSDMPIQRPVQKIVSLIFMIAALLKLQK